MYPLALRVFNEQVRTLYQQLAYSAWTNMAPALLIVVVVTMRGHNGAVALWAATVWATSLGRLRFSQQFRRASPGPDTAVIWYR